jgi:phosphoglycolate phosphatase
LRPRLVIFDFDGTLADSFGWFLDVADAVADRYRFERFDRSEMERLRGLSARQIIQRQRLPLWKLPFVARHARTLMARDIARISLFSGVSTALGELAAAGVTLAIVTTNSRPNVLRVLGPATAPLLSALECSGSGRGASTRPPCTWGSPVTPCRMPSSTTG